MLVYGKNVVLEYLNNNKKIYNIYIQEGFDDKEILNKIKNSGLNYKVLSKYDINKKANGLNQGIVLEVENYKYYELDDIIENDDNIIVMLDHITDPHNMGAIIRTCEAAGVSGIIIPKDRSVEVNQTVIKTSVGTTENVKIVQVSNLNITIDKLKNNGYWIYGTDMVGTNYTELDYKGKICIICGNEGEGMSRLVKENCDFVASIPMKGKVNSLNASVATAIILFEAVKQR